MLSATMLSLARSVALRVPLVAFKSVSPITLQRSPFVSSLPSYRALSTTASLFATAREKATSSVSQTAGRTKAKPKTKAKAKPKAKVKATPKAKAKPKRKAAAKPKPKPSTRVPLVSRPPKRPATPFVLFYNRAFPSPGSRPGGITSSSKEAGTAWRQLTESEKTSFQDEAHSLMLKYYVKRDQWYKDPKNLQLLRTINKDRKKRGKKRIHAPATGGLKRPMPAFLRFVQELRATDAVSPNNAPEGTNVPRAIWAARESGARWQALPASEKEKYTKAYLADFAKWKASSARASV